MGFDKGAALLAGRSLVERAARTLGQVTERVVLACGPEPRYRELGLPLVLDDPALVGPAAGLVAALEAVDAPYVLALACDMPRIDAAVLGALLERARGEELDACLLAGPRGEEPLCGVYRSALAPAVRAAQARGRARVTAFRDVAGAGGASPRVAAFAPADLGHGTGGDLALNLNTPVDLELEQRRWSLEERT